MRNALRSSVRRLAVETRGAEIAEAAAVLPLMFMMLLGIFWFGQAFSIYGAITRAAQEGARAGAAPYCSTCPNNSLTNYTTNAIQAAKTAMTTAKLDPTQAKYPSPDPALFDCLATTATKTCSSGGDPNLCVQAPVLLTDINTGQNGVCGISVSFQYPFQFWLPFTSLNKQRIWITASARVRMENP
jgi:Flp pilus assembly protein TadG